MRDVRTVACLLLATTPGGSDIMRIGSCIALGALLLVLAPSPGSAQDTKKVHVNFGGGPTFNAADLGDHFANGWGPAVGVTFDIKPKIAFQFEYAYRWFDIKDDVPVFEATRFSANHSTHQLAFNLIGSLTPTGSTIRPYVTGGPGMYYRSVEITEYVGSGVICDPYWYVCGTYPIEDVVGSRGGWDFGYNIGGGVGFGIGETAEFFIEMRYHHVLGPDIVSATPLPANTTTSSSGGSSNGSYYPLTFGFRF
jgi:opacity protein-like surface antigen